MKEWNEIDTKIKGYSSELLYIKEKYYMVVSIYKDPPNQNIYYSNDLINWEKANITPEQIYFEGGNYSLSSIGKIGYINGVFLGIVIYTAPHSESVYSVLPGYITSTDGINWTVKLGQLNNQTYYFNNLYTINNTFFIDAFAYGVANSDCFLATKDGKYFQEYKYGTLPNNEFIRQLCYFNNKYYMFTQKFYQCNIYSSSDLINWTILKRYNNHNFQCANVGKGRIIILINYTNDNRYISTKIISSSDGINWIENIITNNSSQIPTNIKYLNGTFMLVGPNHIYLSSNGDDWDQINFDEFIIRDALYVDNNLFLTGEDISTRMIKICKKEISRKVTYASDTALYIFNKDLNLLGVIDECISLTWHRKFYEAGEFSLVVAPYENNLNLLKTDNIIVRQNYTEAAIIDTIEFVDDGTQIEIKASGSFLSYLLHRRIIKNKINFKGSAIDGQKELLANMTELVPNFEIESTKLDSINVDFQCIYKNVYDFMVKLSKYSNIGFRIVPNVESKGFIFENFEGLDRTHNQIKNERYCFSKENGNISKPNIIKTTIGKCNFALVGGTGEDTSRQLVEVRNEKKTGLDLFESFVDAKNESDNSMTKSDYENLLKQKGQEVLQDETLTIEFTGEPTDYKNKWDLGDIVDIVLDDSRISEINRITEVEEVIENNNYSIRPTFGPALADKLNLNE